MAKSRTKTTFLCESCGNESPKWEGRCPSCGQWNSLVEHRVDRPGSRDGRRAPPESAPAQELSALSSDELPRLQTSSAEVNRVLGGGVVPGSLCLIAGDPGIGKSTLMLRIAADVAKGGGRVLYVSGEESSAQVKLRAERLEIAGDGLMLLHTTSLDAVMAELERDGPALCVVDSIQTVYDESLSSAAGSVGQIRECARVLMGWAKAQGVPMVLTGHVTKGGDIAGPRVLEHMVDVVLYMEGDPISSWRLLRAVKNRFGSTNEVGVFEMGERGLADVADPSRTFLSERSEGAVGSVVVPTLEGSRPLLVEVQALTSPSMLPVPRRVASGIDLNRLLLVCAVLTRRAGVSLAGEDVIVNVTGGLRIDEPAADLGVALAIVSSARNAPVASDLAAIGEVGLSGEVRRVPQLGRRTAEVSRLGFRRCLVPAGDMPANDMSGSVDEVARTLREAINAAIPRQRRAQRV
jgi:DNA repair protein RadA/Sms